MRNIKHIIVVLLVVIVIAITFSSKYTSLLQNIESSVKSEEASINRYIDLSHGFIDLLAIHGNNYLESSTNDNDELYSLLAYDESTDRFDLDAVSGTQYQAITGNLTGMAVFL